MAYGAWLLISISILNANTAERINMTEGISKETLIRLMQDPNCDSSDYATYDYLLSLCTELDPWLPIDENTPKDKRILLYFPETYKWAEDCPRIEIGFYNDSFGRSVPTARYKLLTEDTK